MHDQKSPGDGRAPVALTAIVPETGGFSSNILVLLFEYLKTETSHSPQDWLITQLLA